jgi:hypothetical protein
MMDPAKKRFSEIPKWIKIVPSSARSEVKERP